MSQHFVDPELVNDHFVLMGRVLSLLEVHLYYKCPTLWYKTGKSLQSDEKGLLGDVLFKMAGITQSVFLLKLGSTQVGPEVQGQESRPG